tara:strand:+ start:53 stop:433 length:381 start_codon:yes stop_codon:yes gene_type:complete
MIELKQKTPSQIKSKKILKEKHKSIIKKYIKKNKDLSNIDFFDSDKNLYNNLEKQNEEINIFKDSIPVFIAIGFLLIFSITILYYNFNTIIKSNTDTLIFIFLIVSLISIAGLILLKNILIDSKLK